MNPECNREPSSRACRETEVSQTLEKIKKEVLAELNKHWDYRGAFNEAIPQYEEITMMAIDLAIAAGQKSGIPHICDVCGSPSFLWKKGDDKTCYGCRTLFSMSWQDIKKGDYQTRFTAGIHRQALAFAYHNALIAQEEAVKAFADEEILFIGKVIEQLNGYSCGYHKNLAKFIENHKESLKKRWNV
jgi:hypothetical protein